MKRMVVFTAAVIFLICFGAEAFAQEKKAETTAPKKAAASTEKPKTAKKKAAASTKKPKTVKESLVTKTATVEAIDLQTRMVTLKDKDGNVVDLKVSEKAKNLPQVKVGDEVTAQFYKSIAIELAPPGTSMQTATSESLAKAKLGERPGGIHASIVSVVANIEKIDTKKKVATLKGPEGKVVEVKIQDPKKWASAKVGDKVSITLTQAVAIKIKPVAKK